jgi:hypothetical protein
MSSLNNINNNTSVVNVGRTTPVTPGAQPAAKSIPVVVATDQTAIPVVEQNKIQSEVALSLLGIPRSEVALGIFADVNTYDVNPTEWSTEPLEYSEVSNTLPQYSGIGGNLGWGVKHLPEESGAMVIAPPDEVAILTSKRFFRYQPGRVSAATFGIKSSSYQGDVLGSEQRPQIRNPGVNKYGIFDKFDGYYWETSDTGEGDQFRVVRRTQSIIRVNPLPFGNQAGEQLEDHALGGKPPAQEASDFNQYPTATKYLSENRFSIIEKSVIQNEAVKCHRDVGYFLDGATFDVTLGTNYNATFQGLAEANSNEYQDDNTLPAEVITAIANTRSEVKALDGVDTTGDAAVDIYFDRIEAICVDGPTKVDYSSATQTEQINFLKGITYTNPTSGATAGQIAAKDAILANLDFLTEEVNSFIGNYFSSHTGQIEAKCERDVLFAVQAVAYDVLYGGNSATHDAARFFFYDGFSKSDQTLAVTEQTVLAYKHLKGVIDDIILGQAYAPQARCTRDLEYILEGVGYDITLGTNYHATFLGLAESNSSEYPEDSSAALSSADGSVTAPWARVVGAINDTETQVKALAGVDATADLEVDTFYDNLRAVSADQNTRVEYYSETQQKQIDFLKAITFTNPSSGRTASQLACKDKIQANYDFLTAEINAWVEQQYPNSKHPVAKCTRDVLFVANAVAHDMCYGGNFATVEATEFFFYEDFAQTSDVHKNQTVAAYERLVAIIGNVVEGTAITRSPGNTVTQVTSGTDADIADGAATEALVQIVVDAIDAENDTGLPAVVNPDTSWAAASLTNAKTAIDTDANTIATSASATAYSGYTQNSQSQNTANVGTIAEAKKATDLMAIILGVIKEGDIIKSLPGNRDVPDRSWRGAGSLTDAADAIDANKQTILDTVAPIDLSSTDDVKCLRDLEFALDAYIADLRWGGNGHTITNATTYQTALLLDAEREGETHYYFRYVLRDELYKLGELEARDKVADLAAYMLQAVTKNGTPGSKYPPVPGPDGTTGAITQAQVAAATYGQKPKLDTIFGVYDKYLGYLIGESLAYDATQFVNAEKGFSYADAQAYENVLKFKCLRDVKYVVRGYASDLQYGGNAATAYNAKKYYSDGELKVYSQTDGNGVVAEVERHKYLLWLLTGQQPGEVFSGTQTTFSLSGYTDVCTFFALSDAQKVRLTDLATIIINNFNNEYTGSVEFGSAGQFGDLVILRDGLIMVHAAVYDPSLLKKKYKAPAKLDVDNNAIAYAGEPVIIGSYVNYYGDCPDLVNGKTYFVANVTGPKGTVIQLRDPTEAGFNEFDVNPDDAVIDITATGNGPHYIETPVPFIVPNVYEDVDPAWTLGQRRYDGMFPYMYTDTGTLPADANSITAGFIDTAIDTAQNAAQLKTQIDDLNFKYKTWVRDNVDPTYFSVYEYRVGRSRFSGDALDGQTRTAVYSDNVLDKRAGEVFRNGDVAAEQTSVWDFDFSKVTMLKVEFSWYGAVGALFLAYVPVDNGDARWVRVHHLRCSNQLKISSLGNATLPITYLVYGGGSENRFGITNSSRLANPYGTYSEYLVKYGASYYIDGGDRGTVRLFNHSSDTPTDINGSRYTLGVDSANADDPVSPYIQVTNRGPFDSGNREAPVVSTFYIGAQVITGNSQDQNVKVVWIDATNGYLYLNKPISQVSSLSVIVDRPALVYGLKTKDNIVSGDGDDVRNRVQVYPTRLSVGSSGNVNAKLTLLKTPIYQNNVQTVGTLSVAAESDVNASYTIPVDNITYLKENGDFTYGWFLASLNGSETLINVLGRLEKESDAYHFYPTEIYNGTLVLASGATFLKDGVFDPNGNELNPSETTFEKERLSSVEVALRAQAPIPGTGISLASYYIAPGAEEFDLATYFDYNKEYISYPLTDEIATLWLAAYSNQTATTDTQVSLSASFTWEEQ